ncbi:hypothetical protein Sjap_001563 [Stephania japonica]|uniref:EngB-type G domain-containing protein n=1 Tax=Stephania japonica TaxID=461633 RepID=A0AAP0KLP7_9MAGN
MGDLNNGYKLGKKTRVQSGSAKPFNARKSNSRSESMPKSLLSSRRRRVEANEGDEPNWKRRLGGVDAKRKRLYGGDGESGGGFGEGRGGKKGIDERLERKRGVSAARMGRGGFGGDGGDVTTLRTRTNAERRLRGKLGKMRSVGGGGGDDVRLRAGVGDERRGKREFDERVRAKRGMSVARREGRGGRMGSGDGEGVRLRTRVPDERRVGGRLGKMRSVDGADDGDDVRLRTRVAAEKRGKSEFDERVKSKRGMSAVRREGNGDGAGDGEVVRLRTRVYDARRVGGKLGKSEKGFGKGGDLDKKSVKGERNRRRGGVLEGYANKKKDKKDEEEIVNDTPKKRKRIKLDPYDVSNKRMDDGVSMDGKEMEKKVEAEKKTEPSKNAQFRAIQPSPSILSFVEDNLLGRRRSIELQRAGYNVDLSAPLDNIPHSTSLERERCEESVFRNKLTFFAAANVSSSFPPADLPEIAFAGRSNVGKSSLLNALTRQWGVVRTSDKPGLTQTINFFNLGSKMCLVDLPGYGFAYAKEEDKDAWEELVKEYVSTRVGLKRVCLLIDTKWGMKPRDHELVHLMERSQTKYQIVLTKTDMVFPIDLARRAMEIEENLKVNKSVVNPLMMVSSKSGAGIRSLRSVLAKISRFAKP